MTSEQFIYWLQGYFEISQSTKLNEEQVKIVKDHLGLCFNKVTPYYSIPYPIGTAITTNPISCSGPLEFNDSPKQIDFSTPPKIGF